MVNKENLPYAIPMNFVLHFNSIYFHCAKAVGEKLNIIKCNPNVCFTVIDDIELLPEKFTTLYKSEIIFGTIEFVKENQKKEKESN